MKKILQIIKYEMVTTLRRPTYLIVAFGLPILAILVFAGITLFKNQSDDAGSGQEEQPDFSLNVEGYVDPAHLISVVPEDLPPGILVEYPDETSARAALEAGEIEAYYLIPENYVANGELIYINPSTSPLATHDQQWVMRWTMTVNVLGGDIALASRVWNPMDLTTTDLSADPTQPDLGDDACAQLGYACESSAILRFLPMGVLILFFVFMSSSAGMLLKSISDEKQNRVIEILALSVHPRQLLTGKLVGLGLVSLLQVITWMGALFITMSIGGQTLNLPPNFTLPISLLVGSIILFLLGYATYASLMAGAGALVPNFKESSQAAMLVMAPLFIAYMLGLTVGMEAPHGGIMVALSLFPLTSPIAMVSRMVMGGVPVWQITLAAVLLALTSVGIVLAVARMFRAQTLISGEPFSVKRYMQALAGKL